ncbi:MAG TPA: NAD-dependent epimerase/dehydratase family protein [Aquihabitans sp.]|jgi:nucleoside-diphosphate-sugar epimerase|nr:NAD-dependent epimerase/dehydratase family protein [Aquihabitans sp.]
MARVVVTGAASPLGRRVSTLLASRHDVDDVVAVDLRAAEAPGVVVHQLDLATSDLTAAFADADAVVHLASVFGPALEGPEVDDAVEVTMARRVLAAADKASVERVVVLSSATVYGPWANNPVPLTEEAPLRPHPELAFAVQKAEVERLAAEWAADHPGAVVARLRPATVVAEGSGGWLARALHAASGLPTGDDTPAQYLHLDDLAGAVVTAFAERLDGPVNVAPDRWLTPTERRALDPVPKVRLPERAAVAIATWRWRLRLAPTPPGILAYARHPWVVANDRLVAAGWSASHSNEEAYVAGHEARAIESISPQRRQELALGALGAAVAGSVAGGVALVRRHRRRTA